VPGGKRRKRERRRQRRKEKRKKERRKKGSTRENGMRPASIKEKVVCGCPDRAFGLLATFKLESSKTVNSKDFLRETLIRLCL
jgi:hypothetical protein